MYTQSALRCYMCINYMYVLLSVMEGIATCGHMDVLGCFELKAYLLWRRRNIRGLFP